jgi:hypothetical protein
MVRVSADMMTIDWTNPGIATLLEAASAAGGLPLLLADDREMPRMCCVVWSGDNAIMDSIAASLVSRLYDDEISVLEDSLELSLGQVCEMARANKKYAVCAVYESKLDPQQDVQLMVFFGATAQRAIRMFGQVCCVDLATE